MSFSIILLIIASIFWIIALAFHSFIWILLGFIFTFLSAILHPNKNKWLASFGVPFCICLVLCFGGSDRWIILLLMFISAVIPTYGLQIIHGSSYGMSGLQYEQYCADYLRRKGFTNIQVTPASHDYGADIIAERFGERWVFQCKKYVKIVGNSAVQEVNTAKKHYNAKKAAVITNSKLSDNAKQLAMENDIEFFEMID